jgi:hypothetical protein
MNAHFPITEPINRDAEIITDALSARSQEIKKNIDSQTFLRKISLVALKIIGLASTIVTAASIPVAALTFTTTPLTIAAVAVSLAIACLALCILLDAKSPGESIVREHWKELFEALRKGDGTEIIQTCKELAKQKESRATAFAECLGKLSATEITPFFHKTCMVGHLLIAMTHLRNDEEEQVRSHTYIALSHYDSSGFSPEIERFAKSLVDSPKEIRRLIDTYCVGNDLHAMDYLLVLGRKMHLGDEVLTG